MSNKPHRSRGYSNNNKFHVCELLNLLLASRKIMCEEDLLREKDIFNLPELLIMY